MSDKVWEILENAQTLEEGPAQISLCEEAVRIADIEGDDYCKMVARMQFIQAASFGGAPDKVVVAFSWCLSQYDKFTEEFEEFEYDIMWTFKWILDHICDFPNVPREKIRQLEDDMERHFQASNYSLRAVNQVRGVNALAMGDLQRYEEFYPAWQESIRDDMADCPACECYKLIESEVMLRNFEKAIDNGAPIFAGKLSCAEIPHKAYVMAIPALLMLGRTELAAEYHGKGYRLESIRKLVFS